MLFEGEDDISDQRQRIYDDLMSDESLIIDDLDSQTKEVKSQVWMQSPKNKSVKCKSIDLSKLDQKGKELTSGPNQLKSPTKPKRTSNFKKSIAEVQNEALIKQNSQKDSQKQRYTNHGRIRLFRVRNRKTRIHLKILGFSASFGAIYFSFSTSNNYFVNLGFANLGESLILSKLADVVGMFLLFLFLNRLKRRLFLKCFQATVAGRLISFGWSGLSNSNIWLKINCSLEFRAINCIFDKSYFDNFHWITHCVSCRSF